MEQDYGKSGLKSLNPMHCWKYVMSSSHRIVPAVLVMKKPDNLKEIANSNPNVDFIVLEYSDDVRETQNIIFTTRERYTLSEWYKKLGEVDYVLCSKNDPIKFECGLCGVSQIEKIGEIHVLNSVERIENWEKAKNSLDKILNT